jgi:hypothetical protein
MAVSQRDNKWPNLLCAAAAAAAASLFQTHSRSSVLDGARRQKVINALAEYVFKVNPSQVSSASS